MKYSITLLTEKLEHLNHIYDKYISAGGIGEVSEIATRNREQARDIEIAISILENHTIIPKQE